MPVFFPGLPLRADADSYTRREVDFQRSLLLSAYPMPLTCLLEEPLLRALKEDNLSTTKAMDKPFEVGIVQIPKRQNCDW